MQSGSPKVELTKSKSTWSLKVKILRGLWIPFRAFLRLRGPRFLSGVRIFLLRMFGANIGQKVLVLGGVNVWCPWNLRVGDFCAIGFEVEIYNFAPVAIGDSVVVSQYSYLCTASHDYEKSDMALFFKPIIIEPQCWLAAGAFIGPGVTVGEGSVVGAKTVVTRDVAPWCVVAGNPAKVVKNRSLTTAR